MVYVEKGQPCILKKVARTELKRSQNNSVVGYGCEWIVVVDQYWSLKVEMLSTIRPPKFKFNNRGKTGLRCIMMSLWRLGVYINCILFNGKPYKNNKNLNVFDFGQLTQTAHFQKLSKAPQKVSTTYKGIDDVRNVSKLPPTYIHDITCHEYKLEGAFKFKMSRFYFTEPWKCIKR